MDTSYEISVSAEKDWEQIISYTLDRFGKQQVYKYTEGLLNCLDALAFNPKKHKKLNLVGMISFINVVKNSLFSLR